MQQCLSAAAGACTARATDWAHREWAVVTWLPQTNHKNVQPVLFNLQTGIACPVQRNSLNAATFYRVSQAPSLR